MSNSLYWEDALSSSGGKQHDMPVDVHHPSFTVSWGKGKFDDVPSDHSAITGIANTYAPCGQCGIERTLTFGICAPCQRSMHADERHRMRTDTAMGSNKRSTHIITDTKSVHITRDGRITGQTKTPR